MEQRYKKIAITGANSFLGTNVVRELDRRQINTRAIVRKSNNTIDKAQHCTITKGNLLDFNELSSVARGCDCIIHIASITDQSLLRYEDYVAFNVRAIENVIAVARAEGIRRVVFVSSSNAVGNGSPDKLGDETTPINGAFLKQLYGRSKVEAERLLREATDLEGVIVNPCFMLGEFDSKPSSGEIILRCYGKSVVFAPPGGKNFLDVAAAASALVNAAQIGRAGENYLLAGQNISIANFMRLVAQLTAKRSLIIVVPKFALLIAGYFGDIMRFMKIRTQISSTNMRVICTKEYYSAAKAIKELDLAPTDLEDTIRRSVVWFKDQKKLR